MNTFDVRISDTNYFGDKVSLSSNIDVSKFINSNPSKYVRVDIDNFRVLLKPEKNGFRIVDGVNNLAKLYEYFNNINNKLSSILVDDLGPGGIYINREKYTSCS